MSKTGSNLGKSPITRLVNNLVDNIYENLKKRKRENRIIKRNPKLNHNRGVAK